MRSIDLKEKEKSDAKNALEEYVYAMRDKVANELEAFIEEAAREALNSKLSEIEDWLYEDGEDVEKSVYKARLKEIEDVGSAAEYRAAEAATRPDAVEEFQKSIVSCRKFIEKKNGGDDYYTHITEEDMKKVTDALAAKEQWLNGAIFKQKELKTWDTPAVTTAEVVKENKAFDSVWTKVRDIPKPVEEPPKDEAKPAEGEGEAPAAPADDAKVDGAKADDAAAATDEMTID